MTTPVIATILIAILAWRIALREVYADWWLQRECDYLTGDKTRAMGPIVMDPPDWDLSELAPPPKPPRGGTGESRAQAIIWMDTI